jgi:hypothetical protein
MALIARSDARLAICGTATVASGRSCFCNSPLLRLRPRTTASVAKHKPAFERLGREERSRVRCPCLQPARLVASGSGRPGFRAKGNRLPARGQARPNIKGGLDDRAIASVAKHSSGPEGSDVSCGESARPVSAAPAIPSSAIQSCGQRPRRMRKRSPGAIQRFRALEGRARAGADSRYGENEAAVARGSTGERNAAPPESRSHFRPVRGIATWASRWVHMPAVVRRNVARENPDSEHPGG